MLQIIFLCRIQRMQERTRMQQQVAVQNEQQAVVEVNPEFLAALPPNIQEEVLAQQRIEQQRLAAAAANPNDPVDAAAFFQNLQPSLRQAILTDMEDSQVCDTLFSIQTLYDFMLHNCNYFLYYISFMKLKIYYTLQQNSLLFPFFSLL